MPEMFVEREHVRHCLTRMAVIAQTIDHGDGTPPGKLGNMRRVEHSRHDALRVAAEYTRHVRDAFPLTETDFRWTEIQGMTAHMQHGDVETHPRPQRGLLKDHCQ